MPIEQRTILDGVRGVAALVPLLAVYAASIFHLCHCLEDPGADWSTMNAYRISVGMKKMTGPERQKRSVQIDVVRACAILLVVGAHLRFQMPGGIMGSIAWAWHEWVRWILVYPPGGVRCAPATCGLDRTAGCQRLSRSR